MDGRMVMGTPFRACVGGGGHKNEAGDPEVGPLYEKTPGSLTAPPPVTSDPTTPLLGAPGDLGQRVPAGKWLRHIQVGCHGGEGSHRSRDSGIDLFFWLLGGSRGGAAGRGGPFKARDA